VSAEPKLLISVERGRERRVARDLMDALYPHDRRVRVEELEGALLLYSDVSPEELIRLLSNYPIRGVLRVRRLIAYSEGASVHEAVGDLLRKVSSQNCRLYSVEVRVRGGVDRRCIEGIVRTIGGELGLYGRDGLRARLLVLPGAGGRWRAAMFA